MNYIGKFISNFKDFYNEINAATLTGSIDVVVVRQKDGSYCSSPFHVRFGKMGVLRSKEKVVDIEINGIPVDIHMKLGETGEAFFVEKLDDDDEVSSYLGTSPLPTSYFGNREDDIQSQDSGLDAEAYFKVSNDNYYEVVEISSMGIQVPPSNDASYARVEEDFIQFRRLDSSHASGRDQYTQTKDCDRDDLSAVCSLKGEHVRSRSLSSELPLLRDRNVVDGQGSKTDVEEMDKTLRSNQRRRRRKRAKLKNLENEGSKTSNLGEKSSLVHPEPMTAPVTSEEMFIMDDIGAQEAVNLSSSMPALPSGVSPDGPAWQVMSHSIGPDFHPFSDTDISPPPSPHDSRSSTPVKSDTEYENVKQKSDYCNEESLDGEDTKWSWTWGQLPTPPSKVTVKASTFSDNPDQSGKNEGLSQAQAKENERSMIGSMFSFMRATKKVRHNPESEGVYLDDLNLEELDPEVAALYFPRFSALRGKMESRQFKPVSHDDDNESGNGPSLPHSPHSVEGAIGGPKMPCDLDFEESPRHPVFLFRGYNDIAFSLCGALHEHLDGDFPESLFMQSLVTYDDFCENPQLLDSPNLVVRLDNKYMNWSTAAPQILSLVLFQRPLPQKVTDNLMKENMPKKDMRKRAESRGYSWFSWGRSSQPQSEADSTSKTETETVTETISTSLPPSTKLAISETKSEPSTAAAATATSSDKESAPVPAGQRADGSNSQAAHSEPRTASVNHHKAHLVKSLELEEFDEKCMYSRARYKKTLRLSDEEIRKLNLRDGSNEALFSVTTAYQGTTRCKCNIYLWNYDEKIVVSDIDGTITKSDVLGHILPIIGKDWAQSGVAQLFTKIKNNGYKFLYLSSRAIGQAKITRDYLKSIKQGDLSLPEGPLLLNPTSLVQAFHREVIEKKPEEFKISCLKDISLLFPVDSGPFYAGYGNRINDVWAYRSVGIPISRIFTINHKGELKHEMTQTFQTTYSNLSDIAHHMFPPSPDKETPGEFSSLQFWRPLIPDYSQEIEEKLSAEKTSSK